MYREGLKTQIEELIRQYDNEEIDGEDIITSNLVEVNTNHKYYITMQQLKQ